MLWLIFVLALSCAHGQRLQIPTKVNTTSPPRVSKGPPKGPPPKLLPPPSLAHCPCPCAPVQPGATPGVAGPGSGGQNLLSRTGWNIAVSKQGKVYGIKAVKGAGTGWESDGVLQIKNRRNGMNQNYVTIKGLKANLYIAMNEIGEVYAESNEESRNTWWQEKKEGGRFRYKWLGNNDANWFLGIQKNGKLRRGDLTAWNQTVVQFTREDAAARRRGGGKPKPGVSQPDASKGEDETILKDKQLKCGNALNLAVSRDWQTGDWDVYGDKTAPRNGSNNIFWIYKRGPGEVKIKGKAANLYVAMDHAGNVYAEANPDSENNWWKMKKVDDLMVSYEWLGNHEGWLLGLNLNGRPKRGNETRPNTPSFYFFPPLDVWKMF